MVLIAIMAMASVCVFIAAWIILDMVRFRGAQKRAEDPTAAQTNAGGTLYIESDRTYYRMPSGTVRKIADYRMDLRPGSPDMNMLTAVLDQAAREHEQEVAAKKAEALKNVRAMAKEGHSL